jgi:hypothetical protein
MKDVFGNRKPVQIDLNEWWFNGRIIVKQDDYRLPTWISFLDSEISNKATIHLSKSDAVSYALENPFLEPDNQPEDYIGLC